MKTNVDKRTLSNPPSCLELGVELPRLLPARPKKSSLDAISDPTTEWTTVNPLRKAEEDLTIPTPTETTTYDFPRYFPPIFVLVLAAMHTAAFCSTTKTRCDNLGYRYSPRIFTSQSFALLSCAGTVTLVTSFSSFSERCSHIRLFKEKYYACFIILILILTGIFMQERNGSFPSCDDDVDACAHLLAGIETPTLPETGVCGELKPSEKCPLPSNKNTRFASALIKQKYGVEPDVALAFSEAGINYLIEDNFDFSKERRCVEKYWWYFTCASVSAPCTAACKPIGFCPSACQAFTSECSVLVDWFLKTGAESTISRFVAIVGSIGIAEYMTDFISGVADCSFPGIASADASQCVGLNGTIVYLDNVTDAGSCGYAAWDKYEHELNRSQEADRQLKRCTMEANEVLRDEARFRMIFIVLAWYTILLLCILVVLMRFSRPQIERQRVFFMVPADPAQKTYTERGVHTQKSLFCLFLLSLVCGTTWFIVLKFLVRVNAEEMTLRPQEASILMATFQLPLYFFLSGTAGYKNIYTASGMKSLGQKAASVVGNGSGNSCRSVVGKHITKVLLFYDEHLSYDGRYYLVLCGLLEILEMLIQGNSFRNSLYEADHVVVFLYGTVLSLNALITPYVILSRNRERVLLVDAIFDLSYIFLNASKLLFGENVKVKLGDVASLAWPCVTVSFSIYRIMKRQIHSEKEKVDKIPGTTQSRKRPGVLRSFRLKRLSRSLRSMPRFQLAFRLIYVLSINAMSIISILVLGMHLQQLSDCSTVFGKCVWNHVFPRVYLEQGEGVFSARTCVTSQIETLDVSACDITEIGYWMRHFNNVSTVKINPSIENIDELARAAFYGKLRKVYTKQHLDRVESIDLSNLDLMRSNSRDAVVPSLLSYARNLKSLNLSGIGFSTNEGVWRFLKELHSDSRIASLDLSRNSLTSLPPALYSDARFQYIKTLDLQYNNFDALGVMFGRWVFAKQRDVDVRIAHNPVKQAKFRGFREFPRMLYQVADSLQFMDLCCTKEFVGSFPSEISAFSRLDTLFIYKTGLYGTM